MGRLVLLLALAPLMACRSGHTGSSVRQGLDAAATSPGNPPAFDPFNRPRACRQAPREGPRPTFTESLLPTGSSDGSTGVAAAVGSVDADGRPDLVLAHSVSNSPDVAAPRRVRILPGRPAALPGDPSPATVVGSTGRPALVDVNADGRHDVVNQGLASLAEASGRLAPAEQVTANITGTARWGNLNADAFPDLLIGTLSQFSVRLGTASGVLAAPVPRPHDIARFWNLFYVGLHDVDGDGFDDLVTLDQVLSNMDSYPPATLRLYLNDRGGGFAAPSPLDLPGGVSAQDLAFGDFNCDGRLDLVTTNPDRLRVEVRLRGPDSWQPPQALSAGRPDPLAGGVHAVAVGDVNGDGAHDLVVASTVFVQPSAIPAGDVEIFLGNGSGTLPRDPIVLVSKTEGFAPQVVTVGDLDNNGLDDIIVLLVEREDVAVVWRSDKP